MKDARSDAELNRVIAEWCGWKPTEGDLKAREAWASITEPPDFYTIAPPNYCTDLNAIHEAEKKLIDWVAYRIRLSNVVGIGSAPDLDTCDDIKSFLSSESRQRAEALVAVIEANK